MSSNLIKHPDVLDKLETGIATQDDALIAITTLAAMKQAMKELGHRIETALIQWINDNGEIECGDIRYYVGTESVTKCNDLGQAVQAILRAVGGDVDLFVSCLSSGALKPGASRAMLGDDAFASHFTTIKLEDLKTGKPRKGLKQTNTKFIKGKAVHEEE